MDKWKRGRYEDSCDASVRHVRRDCALCKGMVADTLKSGVFKKKKKKKKNNNNNLTRGI